MEKTHNSSATPTTSTERAAALARQVEFKIGKFLGIDSIQQLENIKSELGDNNKLRPMLDSLVEFLKRCETQKDIYEPGRGLGGTLFQELTAYVDEYFDSFLHFWILQIYLDKDGSGPLGGMIGDLNRQTLREEFEHKEITPKVFQSELLKVIGDRVFEKVKHGGRTTILNDTKRTIILANYNRYMIVIANARKRAKILAKDLKKAGTVDAERESQRLVIELFHIPDAHDIKEVFNKHTSPANLAKEWIRRWKDREYTIETIENLIKSERKKWKKSLGRHAAERLRLVGLHLTGAEILVYYAVDAGAEAKQLLRYRFDGPLPTPGLRATPLTSRIFELHKM